MKGYKVTRYIKTLDELSDLYDTDIPDPVPAPDEVLISIECAGPLPSRPINAS
jgi:NADPH:quinone reductase-like Zn-dependent oxidoreductase